MSTDKELVVNTIEELRENVNLFYQQKTGEALKKFDAVLEKTAGLVDALFLYKEKNQEFPLDEEKIKGVLTESMNALEDGDMVLLADIIQYDFVDYIDEILEKMK